MFDFEFQRCTRRCAKTGAELRPGQPFYSVLVERGGQIVRIDYSEQGWEGAPEDALGWWKSQIPAPDAQKIHWAPNDVMLHYFEQLEGQPNKEDVRYVLTLLMIRRRLLRLDATETNAEGREVLVLFCPRNEQQYQVPISSPTEERVTAIQEELGRLLY
jgi:hypothetical protein